MNTNELLEIDPYEEVSQQGQVPPLLPVYVPDPIELDEHVLVYVSKPKQLGYHASSDDYIHVKAQPYADDASSTAESPGYIADSDLMGEDDDEDPEEDRSKEREPKDDDEDLEEDPNEELSEGSDETEPFEEDETAITPPPPRHRRERISIKPQTPMAASTHVLIDAFAAGSPLFPLPPTIPTYDQAPLESSTAIALEHLEISMILVEDVGALHASEHRMITSIEEVNLRISYQAQVRRQESKYFYTLLHDAQTDRRDIRLEIDVVRGQRTAYETELQEVRQAYLSSEAQNRALVQSTGTCFECEELRHFKKNCPKLKNNGNANRNGGTRGKAYVLSGGDSNLETNTVMGTFLLNNRYASILFDTGVDRSFVSTTFSALLNITPTALDNQYDIELADGKIIEVNTILIGCTLDFLNHLFNIDLMPVPLDSFDVIIGMDWLREYHAVIVCDKKIVRVSFGNETLIFQGKRNDQVHEPRLNIILCVKAQKYLSKGCDVFFAHVTMKEAKDKSEGKRLEDVPIVKDFLEVFPKDFLGIPPARQVKFQIDLVPGAAPVA
nr:putative reverse transcriptase domain-containing protein [Tanacetum cinerariifolium]